jgi:hypothetical protein
MKKIVVSVVSMDRNDDNGGAQPRRMIDRDKHIRMSDNSNYLYYGYNQTRNRPGQQIVCRIHSSGAI